jgi:tetratricopeptide (TPR) repeat protein
MAVRGSGGLFLCVGLLLAMPARAATAADRDECAASADKPDVGRAACSRLIDDASESVAERVEAFKNRGRGSFNRKDYDRAIADYSEAVKLSPKDAWAFAHLCEAYESQEDHDAAIADCTEAIKIDPKYGWAYNNRGVAYYGLHEYDAALADHAEAISSRDAWAYARHGMAWMEKGEFDKAVADITDAVTIDPKYAFGFGQRGQALFRKRLITKKGGWEPAIADYSEAINSIQIWFGCTARVASPTATVANTI